MSVAKATSDHGLGQAWLRAGNLGDDADTTGVVCGQFAGAMWGESGIPVEWLAGLAEREMIEQALTGHATPTNVLDVVMGLRKQDRERRHRMSPQTAEQQRFVKGWLTQEPAK